MRRSFSLLFVTTASCGLLSSCAQPGVTRGRPGHPECCPSDSGAPAPTGSAGRAVFLKNCAHCHAADAHGNEGPDLHHLDWSAEQIATRVRQGKKGQMPAFAGKLSARQITDVVSYLQTLR